MTPVAAARLVARRLDVAGWILLAVLLLVFPLVLDVRPLQDGNTTLYPSGKYMYNDGDGSTGFDREFAMFLSEVWAEAHWADAHIQLPEWSDYRADFSLLNGRVYPDTLAPNGSIDPFHPGPRPTRRRPDRTRRAPGAASTSRTRRW